MRYILTGKYADGTEYGEAVTSLADMAYILSDINRWSNDTSVSDDQRIDANTVVIETEEE